jgi:hypothetical protein
MASDFPLCWRWILGGVAIALTSTSTSIATADTGQCVASSEHAQNFRDEGKLVAARAELLVCAAEACPTVIRKDCADWLVDVDARLPSIILDARDAGGHDVAAVRVSLDGVLLVARIDGKAIPVDPGEHTLRFTPEQGAPVEQRLVVRERDKGRLVRVVLPSADPASAPPASAPPPVKKEAEPPAVPAERRIPLVSYVLGGVSLVGVAGFVYFWLSAVSEAKDLQQTCASRGCVESDLSPPRTKATISAVSLGVGVGAALVSAGFVVFQRPSVGAVRVAPTNEGLGISLGRAF